VILRLFSNSPANSFADGFRSARELEVSPPRQALAADAAGKVSRCSAAPPRHTLWH